MTLADILLCKRVLLCGGSDEGQEESRFTNCACVCLQVLLLLLSSSAVLVGALSLTALCSLFP